MNRFIKKKKSCSYEKQQNLLFNIFTTPTLGLMLVSIPENNLKLVFSNLIYFSK